MFFSSIVLLKAIIKYWSFLHGLAHPRFSLYLHSAADAKSCLLNHGEDNQGDLALGKLKQPRGKQHLIGLCKSLKNLGRIHYSAIKTQAKAKMKQLILGTKNMLEGNVITYIQGLAIFTQDSQVRLKLKLE